MTRLCNQIALIGLSLMLSASGAWALPKCPSNPDAFWSNCVGTYNYTNGSKYIGEYKDGQRSGQGTLTYANGEKYVGEYRDDKRNGLGSFTYADGSTYVGEWYDNKRHGQAIYTYADGAVKEGSWENDELTYSRRVELQTTVPVMGDGVADALAAEPKTATTALPSVEEEPLTVTMTAQGVIFIQKTEVPTAELVTRLRAIAAGRTSNKIYLRADGANTWNSVAEVLGALQAGGFSDIGVVSDFGGTATAALVTSNSVADALAAAVATSGSRAVPASPSLTGSERDSFRIAVNRCWNVDPGTKAANVIIEVGFTLNRDGTLDGEPRLLSSEGDLSATSTAFEAARRAILRCQRGGYQLPADKYDQWREGVITFDPSGLKSR